MEWRADSGVDIAPFAELTFPGQSKRGAPVIRLSDEQRATVASMIADRICGAEIAEYIGCSVQTVPRVLQREGLREAFQTYHASPRMVKQRQAGVAVTHGETIRLMANEGKTL